jgi:hypothetical protein
LTVSVDSCWAIASIGTRTKTPIGCSAGLASSTGCGSRSCSCSGHDCDSDFETGSSGGVWGSVILGLMKLSGFGAETGVAWARSAETLGCGREIGRAVVAAGSVTG